MSTLLTATRRLLVLRKRSTADAVTLRHAIESRGDAAEPTSLVKRVAHVTERTVAGRRVIRLTPRRSPRGTHLIYTHGGCYVFPIGAAQWGILARLVARSGVSIDVPLYGLAPEHTVSDALPFLEEVFDQATTEFGAAVHLGGDSAGGGLALAQAQQYRDRGGIQPASIVLISPWVEATMTNPGVDALAPLDHMLAPRGLAEAGRMWAGELAPTDPLVSPLLGDLASLPPIHIQQGDHDVLFADAEELARIIARAGGHVDLHVVHGGFHDFPGAPWVPEARTALDEMASVLREPR